MADRSAALADRRLASKIADTRLTTVWIVAAIAVPTAIAASIPLAAVDLAYHLRAGDLMLDAGSVLRRDVFTSSALGAPWLNQQWGAQVVLGGLFDVGGWLALATLRAAVAATVTGLLYTSCRNAGASRRSSAGLTLAAGILLAGGFLVRPQLFGILWFALTQWLLSRRDHHPKGLLWALPIAVLWANTHGSFFLAPVLFGVAWAQDLDARRATATRTLVVGLATIPLTLLNPFGVRVWGYVVSVATDERIRSTVAEWRPPTPDTLTGVLFLASVVGAAWFVVVHRSQVRWPVLVGLGLFLAIGIVSIRGGVWWYLAAPVLLASIGPRTSERTERADPRGSVNAVLVGVFCAIALVPLLRWVPYRDAVVPEGLLTDAPPGITRALERVLQPGEAFFNAQEWGSWFEFALPDRLVFVDSRFELIPEPAWQDYDAVSVGASGWQDVLDDRGFDVVALARDQQGPLLPAIADDPGWVLVYEDETGAVFRRSGAG
jgi:hypothetical protein